VIPWRIQDLKKGNLELVPEYHKDVDVTAREHGHNELAEMIAMPSRELPCDRDMETLTIGTLIDAVQQERSLANYDSIYSSHSDDDSSSSPSGYNGDCDSEDDQFEDNTDAIFGGCESQNSIHNSDLNDEKKSLDDVIIQEPESPSDDQFEDNTDAIFGGCESQKSLDDVIIQEPESPSDITVLHFAASSGSLENVKCLVEHGADVNCERRNFGSALHAAALSGSLEIVKYLVEHGADVNLSVDILKAMDDENLTK
ncbi:ankyrin repeat domain-containing, partial [Paramuricea clavata]